MRHPTVPDSENNKKSSPKSWSSDMYGSSKTAHQEPDVVVEYDGVKDSLEKFDDSSGNRTVISMDFCVAFNFFPYCSCHCCCCFFF